MVCQDANFGLAKQLVGALHQKNIQRLTQTYVTLSLEDIAGAVKLGGAREAETHVLRMVRGTVIMMLMVVLISFWGQTHAARYSHEMEGSHA